MVKIQHKLDRFQSALTTGFYGILKCILSLILGFLVSKCEIFENFSPFSLILLSVSPNIGLIPTFCYFGSAMGVIFDLFSLSVFKYITALTMIYIVHMVFRKSLNIIKNDTAVLSAACCFISGFLFLLIDHLTLFNVLILIAESILVCCCIYFIAYAVRGFRQSCFLTSRELIAAGITLVLILIALHRVYLFSMSVARVVALCVIFLGLYCLKTSHAAVLGSCLAIILAAVGNGGEAIFSAVVVGTLVGCVFSSFSERFALTAFLLIYYVILFFYGKFPWSYWYFAEPMTAYVLMLFIPKQKLRSFLSAYIKVKSNKGGKEDIKNEQRTIEACYKECGMICSNASICYEKNAVELSDAIETATSKFLHTEELTDIEDLLPFCSKPNTMSGIIKNKIIHSRLVDSDDMIEQLERLSKKIENKLEFSHQNIIFLNDEEQEIKKELERRRLVVININFIIDEYGCKKCEIQFRINGDLLYEKILRETVGTYFERYSLKIANNGEEYTAYLKESGRFDVQCSALCKTQSGEQISGDTALGFSVGKDYYYLILADGMGSGREAGVQSSLIINLLKRLITGGTSVVHALNIYRSMIRLYQGLYFTTVDLCAINLEHGNVELYKAGAYDSFLLHDQTIKVLKGGGIPLGLSEHDRLLHRNIQAEDGDFLILASDGLSVLSEKINDTILRCKNDDTRVFAKNILNTLCEECGVNNDDDVTVMVCKFQKNE